MSLETTKNNMQTKARAYHRFALFLFILMIIAALSCVYCVSFGQDSTEKMVEHYYIDVQVEKPKQSMLDISIEPIRSRKDSFSLIVKLGSRMLMKTNVVGLVDLPFRKKVSLAPFITDAHKPNDSNSTIILVPDTVFISDIVKSKSYGGINFAANKIVISGICFFLILFLASKMQYYEKLSKYYSGRAMAIELFEGLKDNTASISLAEAILMVSADKVNFKMPKIGFDEITEYAKSMKEIEKEKEKAKKPKEEQRNCCICICCSPCNCKKTEVENEGR